MVLGASASLLGRVLLQYRAEVSRVGGILVVVMGLDLLGVFRLVPLLREKRIHFTSLSALLARYTPEFLLERL